MEGREQGKKGDAHKMLSEDKWKDMTNTISLLIQALPYLQAVRETVAGGRGTREGSQDTGMDTASIFSGSSPESDIDLHQRRLPSFLVPPVVSHRRICLDFRPTEGKSKQSNPVWDGDGG